MLKRRLLAIPAALAVLLIAGLGARSVYSLSTAVTPANPTLPTAAVKRGDVSFTVAAKGELQGGNSETLVAPMTGSGTMSLTFLRESGELVKQGEVVARFDTTEQ